MVQNFGNLMKQARVLQEKIANLQAEMEKRTVEASAGGGMVTVVINGKLEILDLKIDREVVNPEEVDMLQDLVMAAVNEGVRKAKEMTSSAMAQITGGLNIPGLF